MADLRRAQLKLIFPALTLICFFALTEFVQSTHAQGVDPRLTARAQQISGDSFPFQTRTTHGVRVLARTRPRMETLRAIDDGLTELFNVARRHGYNSHLNYSDYTVFIARADRLRDSQGNYSPDVAVPAGQYAGGYYDQGGFIYAAGMVLAFNPSAFVIAEHDRDFERVANVVRYEGEHLVLYYNDRALFQKTMDHSRGGGHPILQ
ncbi:MAG: hypothetical protein AUG51_12270 [Acidobacteria bacterium 13_1_20CM_3_53_8]|nr:MAG: hypothetical protein AUG51_12270 [Acidobacteria bacterium 13_1_20CM_3_53_8]